MIGGAGRFSRPLDEWLRAVKIDATPLIMVNRVLILSISLPSYQRRAPSVG
jgi:hypothetical protein